MNSKKLKIGDKVKMLPSGFHYFHDLDQRYDSFIIPGEQGIRADALEWMLCEVLAIQGTGVINSFNSEGDPFIKWTYKNAGMYFFHSFHYGKEDVRKLTLLEKLCSFFK